LAGRLGRHAPVEELQTGTSPGTGIAGTEPGLIEVGAWVPPETWTWVSVDGARFLITISVAVELPTVTGVKLS
jgi:hypothetical protein